MSFEQVVLARFDQLDSRLDRVDSRLEKVDSRLEKVDSGMEGLEARMGRLDLRFDQLVFRVEELRGQLLEAMEERIQKVRHDMSGSFDATFSRLDRLQDEYHMLLAGLSRVEELLALRGGDHHRLAAVVKDLEACMKALEAQRRPGKR